MKAHRKLQQIRFICISALIAFSAALHGQSPSHERTFRSVVGKYIAYYPRSWYVADRKLGTLYILSFPPSQSARGSVLPDDGGAMISITPPPHAVLTIDQWIEYDTVPGNRQMSKDTFTLRNSRGGKPIDVTELVLNGGRPGIEVQDVVCYFSFSGHLLVARLSYWLGDKGASDYRRTLHSIIENLIPLN